MTAETGEATNLTDDGLSGDLLSPESDGAGAYGADLFPAWSPDGAEIAFVRAVRGDDEADRTLLMRVPAAGGEAVEIHEVSATDPFSVPESPAFTPDGQHLLFTVGHRQRDDPENGVWIVGRDGSDPRQLAGATNSEQGYPILMEVSPRGDLALAVYDATRRVPRGRGLVDPDRPDLRRDYPVAPARPGRRRGVLALSGYLFARRFQAADGGERR
jgi:Tol biopolymer transport system component